jgi:hypothetical protein
MQRINEGKEGRREGGKEGTKRFFSHWCSDYANTCM